MSMAGWMTLKQWVTSLSRWDVARFFELKWSLNGVADSARLRDALIHHVADEQTAIEALEKRFASVATNLMNGQEVWLQHGSLLEAVWASIALPGTLSALASPVASGWSMVEWSIRCRSRSAGCCAPMW
jgi:NTE family protein